MTATNVGACLSERQLRHTAPNGPRRALWVMKGLGLGGAERLAVTSAQHFDRLRYEIEVAYVLPSKDAFVADLRRAGIPTHCVGDGGGSLRWVAALARLARSGRFDLIHTHSPLPALALRALPRSARPPVVHTEHNVWGRYRMPTRVANALTYARNDAVLAVSQGVADSVRRPRTMWARAFPSARVLHHGIDPAVACAGAVARRHARTLLDLPLDVPVLGTVANCTPKKDQATLLTAVARLAAAGRDLRLVLIGSGPLEDALRRQATATGLNGIVSFAGARADVAKLLPAFDVFTLSSLHEGLPISLLEAMASGVAPVVTAVGGVPEVVTDHVDGLLVRPGDPAGLAGALASLLDDHALRERLASAAQRRSRDFGIDRAVRFMEDWYDEVLA